jgi:neutral ceramidase
MNHVTRYASAAACLLAAGCRPDVPKIPGKLPGQPAEHRAAPISVGVARADITVPPGASTFGHGHDSRANDGYWTRLYCRAFYFESAAGQKLALVPCELPAMSGLLQRQVSEEVSDLLHASQIMLTAVHTHAGFGHYFGAAQYTSLFSSRLPGYDDELMHTLASRIAGAIRKARANAGPAQLSWSHHSDFWCFTRNRSLAAHQLNRPAPVSNRPDACTRGLAELEAIDPALDVLRIDALDGALPGARVPIGSLSFFAMHPTVVSSANQFLGADVAGVVSRDIERELRRERCRGLGAGAACTLEREPLHAVINTNEGDIAPIWSRGDIEEAVALGRDVAAHVWRSHPALETSAANPTPVLDSRYIEESLRHATFVDAGQRFQTCAFAQFGLGAARGAVDHPTSIAPLAVFGSESPADFGDRSCHAPKRPLLGFVSRLTRGAGSFPSDVPLAVAQLDDTLIAFVPAEMTLTAGHRLRQRIRSELAPFPDAPRHTVIAGLSNEYIEYITTEEEYQLQAYEGASTLYGPSSSRYLTNRFGLLARAMFDARAVAELRAQGLELGEAKEMAFAFGPSVSKLPSKTNDERPRATLGTCLMPEPLGVQKPPRLCMYWSDRDLGALELMSRPENPEPWVRVVADDAARHPFQPCEPGTSQCDPLGVDDRGYEFQTRVHQELKRGWIWSTLFSPRPETWALLATVRARIQVRGAPALESSAFSSSSLPARCSMRQARLCTAGARTEQWRGLLGDD